MASSDGDLNNMWNEATQNIASIDPGAENWKIQALPLARVKKIMKSEEIILQELERERQRQERAQGAAAAENEERPNVKFMISGEAPVLMSKACELLIKDLSFRAWQHTERNRRRTLQRQDLHAAVGESEVYDFLIDIVPRVQTTQPQAPPAAPPTSTTLNAHEMSMMQAAIPPGFQVPQQMSQMAANLNHATMQQTAQAMAASVPVGAPPPAMHQQHQQPAPAAATLDSTNSANVPGGMLQYVQTSAPTEAMNHLVQWDPSQLTFQPVPAQEGGETQVSTANPVPVNAPAPQQQHQQQQPPQQQHHHQVLQQHYQQQQQQHQQPLHQQLQQLHQQQMQQQQHQQQMQLQQPPAAAHQQPPQQHQQQQQQQPSQPQQLQQPNNHQQWMDPTTLAALGATPSVQQAPGV